MRKGWLVAGLLIMLISIAMVGNPAFAAKKKTPTPASQSTAVSQPASTATTKKSTVVGHPALIYTGTCGKLGSSPAFQLTDVAETASSTQGAIAGEMSATTINTSLTQLVGTPYAIALADSAQSARAIACGDIGGQITGKGTNASVVIGLAEAGRSGYTGVAWLREESKTTTRVYVFLLPPKGKV